MAGCPIATLDQTFSSRGSFPALGVLHRPDRDLEEPCWILRTKRKVHHMDSIERANLKAEQLCSNGCHYLLQTPCFLLAEVLIMRCVRREVKHCWDFLAGIHRALTRPGGENYRNQLRAGSVEHCRGYDHAICASCHDLSSCAGFDGRHLRICPGGRRRLAEVLSGFGEGFGDLEFRRCVG